MTKNNYPEGLDELAIAVAKEEGKNYVQGWIPQSHFNYYARALLDAVAEGGYMLVDAKKQEPVAWGAFYFGGKYDGKPYSILETKEQIDGYIANVHQSDDSTTLRAAPLYTHPAIPGRVALPDGWVPVPVEPTSDMLHCAEMWDDGFAGAWSRALSAAPTPPTQPQGDGSLRREAE